MNKAILLTGIVLIVVILGIFAVSAIIIYSSDDDRVIYIKPSLTYDDDYNPANEKTAVISIDTYKKSPCYQGVDQERDYPCIQEVPQDRTPCYKKVKLPCGKEKTVRVSCYEEPEQVKGCGHLDIPEQEKGECYKKVKLPCGEEKTVRVSCYDGIEQERVEKCYDSLEQEKGNCYKEKVTKCY